MQPSAAIDDRATKYSQHQPGATPCRSSERVAPRRRAWRSLFCQVDAGVQVGIQHADSQLISMHRSKGISHSPAQVPLLIPVIVILREQRIGLAHLFDGDGRNAGRDGLIHRFDEFVRDDRITGVGRMNAVQREKSTQETSRQFLKWKGWWATRGGTSWCRVRDSPPGKSLTLTCWFNLRNGGSANYEDTSRRSESVSRKIRSGCCPCRRRPMKPATSDPG